MKEKKFLSTTELAKMLGISTVAVFKKIKKGEIKAEKVGHNFVIQRKDLDHLLGGKLSQVDKKEIEKAVKKTVREYGETLKLLGQD